MLRTIFFIKMMCNLYFVYEYFCVIAFFSFWKCDTISNIWLPVWDQPRPRLKDESWRDHESSLAVTDFPPESSQCSHQWLPIVTQDFFPSHTASIVCVGSLKGGMKERVGSRLGPSRLRDATRHLEWEGGYCPLVSRFYTVTKVMHSFP